MTTPAGSVTPERDLDQLVHAYADGELDPANALAVKHRIDSNPGLTAELANVAALRATLRKRFPREPVPLGLRSRIQAATAPARRWQRPTWAAMAASLLIAVLLSSGTTWFALRTSETEAALTAIVDGHVRSLMAQSTTDVASSERHTVRPWFNGRIPNAPRVVDLASDGFPLIGARIDVMGTMPVPTLVYNRRLHVISVTAIPASNGPAAATSRSVNGYNVVSWRDGDTTFWAASDLNTAELETFARLFRDAPPG